MVREYLLAIIGTVLLSAILTAILPNGRTSSLVKAITRLACVLAIVSPVLAFMQSGTMTTFYDENSQIFFSQSVIEEEDVFINYYSEMRAKETERALVKEILEKWQIDAQIELDLKNVTENMEEGYGYNTIEITQINVKLKQQEDEEVLRNMWEYLTKNYCREVLIE